MKLRLLSVTTLLIAVLAVCGCADTAPAGNDGSSGSPGSSYITAESHSEAAAGDDLSVADGDDAKTGSGNANALDAEDKSEDTAPDTVVITNIQDYSIVYPENPAALERASAQFLADYIFMQTGVLLGTTDDAASQNEYEILIGGTGRAESHDAMELDFAENSLLIKADGSKIVLYGDGLMVAGAVGQFARHCIDGSGIIHLPFDGGTEEYETATHPRNAIVMIGDGMGFAHVDFAKENGLEAFTAELLPNKGSLLTGCYPDAVTDSAAAATALSSGYKTRYTYVGVDKDKVPRQNIRELAYENGYMTAIITTDILAGATPASFLAHVDSRYKTAEIYAQIEDVKEKEGDMLYIAGTDNKPLLDDISTALKSISAGGENFFVMIEEEWIDYYAHYYERANLIDSIRRFDEAVAYVAAFAMAHPGTILIVAADHETGGLTRKGDGTFSFTSGREHTKMPVPIYAWGTGTEMFDGKETENTEVARFLARALFGAGDFGDFG